MNAEEIKLAFRLLAMGRVNHPMVEQLAEAVAKLTATPQPVDPEPVSTFDAITLGAGLTPAKRTRKVKAE